MKRACFCFLWSVVMVVTALAQTPERLPSFEVASVKRNVSGEDRLRMVTQPGGRLIVTNARLKALIANAFEMADSPSLVDVRILGGPDWIGSERYDINAKANTEFKPSPDGPPRELLLMIRSLLEERFKLKAPARHASCPSTSSSSREPTAGSHPRCASRPPTARRRSRQVFHLRGSPASLHRVV
jgi:hypothetical protein